MNLGYKHVDRVYRFTDRVGSSTNVPVKGQCGFQNIEGSSWALFTERRKTLIERHDECQLCLAEMRRKEIHHVDGDHGNQEWENLLVVCPSCHKKEHYKTGRTKRGEKGLEVCTEKIASIEFLEMDDVYDVEMEGPAHNFAVESGIITSNSHAAAYGIVAYISMWLKVTRPHYYWSAVLEWNARKREWDEALVNKRAAAAMGITFAMPAVDHSFAGFDVVVSSLCWDPGSAITVLTPRWGLNGIRGIGKKVAEEIVRARTEGGPFICIKDFHKRVAKRIVRAPCMLALAYAGAFDCLGDRMDITLWLYGLQKGKAKAKVPHLTETHMLLQFHRAMGFFEDRLSSVYGALKGGFTEAEVRETLDGEPVRCGGMVSEVHSLKTKKGDRMGIVTLVDADETIIATFFPTAWTKHRADLKEGAVLSLVGTKSAYRGRQNQIQVERVDWSSLSPF